VVSTFEILERVWLLTSVSIPGRVFLFPGIREWHFSFRGARELWRILWGTDDRKKSITNVLYASVIVKFYQL